MAQGKIDPKLLAEELFGDYSTKRSPWDFGIESKPAQWDKENRRYVDPNKIQFGGKYLNPPEMKFSPREPIYLQREIRITSPEQLAPPPVRSTNVKNFTSLKRFTTSYKVSAPSKNSPHKPTLELWAESQEHAEELCSIRGIGETYYGEASHDMAPFIRCSGVANLIRDGRFKEAIHEANILCWVGISSGAITPTEAFADDALMHELAHVIHLDATYYGQAAKSGLYFNSFHINDDSNSSIMQKNELIRLATAIEKKVPGWRPTALPINYTMSS